MQISVLSGKGGTGKTTVAVNLASVMGYRYVDCDVEEPNGFIFLKPDVNSVKSIQVLNPMIDNDKCAMCNKCVEICQYNALARTPKGMILFEKLCHGCGACMLACSSGAINEGERPIGKIEIGSNGQIQCLRGVLDVGEPMAGPIISGLKKLVNDNGNSIIDCSPGSSCNVVKAVIDSDFALVVTEPTEFGLHDLKITVSLLRKLGIPFAVIINRDDGCENVVTAYCSDEGIKVIARIPFRREIALLYSKGKLLIENQEYLEIFKNIAIEVKEEMTCSL